MVGRSTRIAQFVTDREPAPDAMVQLLCQDHIGTYTLPFLCYRVDGIWRSKATNEPLDVDVVGWRLPPSGLASTRPFWAHRLSALKTPH